MDRREFLRRALSLAPAAIIVPAAVSYFLPPHGGWPRTGLTAAKIRRAKELLAGSRGGMLMEREMWEEAYRDMMVYGTSVIRVTPRADLIGAPVLLELTRIPPRDWFTLNPEGA